MLCWSNLFLTNKEFYLKNSVDWVLVKRGCEGPDWNEIIRSPCPATSLSEALLRACRDRVSKRTIVVRTSEQPWFNGRCVLSHSAKQRAYRVWSRSRKQAD